MARKRDTKSFALQPIAGSRFQPTGFPDLGAAEFDGPDGRSRLLVESVQSLANHLEMTTWDEAQQRPASIVDSLPYVRVVDADGAFLTSSRLEAHRLASAYVLDSQLGGTVFRDQLLSRLGLRKNGPLELRPLYREIFVRDPLSLLHGVFFAQSSWPWQPKISRAITAFIEASEVTPAVSGGVKKDSVNNNADPETGRTADRGYGMVPHHRTEYVAKDITLYVVIDEQQIRSYGLADSATELLIALAHWQVAALLDDGLRLRTACDLVLVDESEVPDLTTATDTLSQAISAASGELGSVTELVWTGPAKKK